MIPMSCPNCGRRGNIPLDRLNTRMHCKKCDAVFHLDASGKPVMGEPKSAKANKPGRAGAHAHDDQFDPIGILASKVAKIPKMVWMVLGGVLGAYLLFLVFSNFKGLPKSVEQGFNVKNNLIAEAFLNRDLKTITKYATSDSHQELAKLVDTFRPMVGDKSGNSSSGITVMVYAPDPLPEVPKIEVSIMPPADAEGKTPPIFYLDLVWQKTDGKYYLNGKATLETNIEREKARKAAEGTTPGKRRPGAS